MFPIGTCLFYQSISSYFFKVNKATQLCPQQPALLQHGIILNLGTETSSLPSVIHSLLLIITYLALKASRMSNIPKVVLRQNNFKDLLVLQEITDQVIAIKLFHLSQKF